MRAWLEVISGVETGKRILVKSGCHVRVGRAPGLDLSLPNDPVLDDLHYQLGCAPDFAAIRNASETRPLFVNGRPVSQLQIKSGDLILAGVTMFAVAVQPDPPKIPQTLAYKLLSEQREHLFALLDPSADKQIGPLLSSNAAHYTPLEGRGPLILLVTLAQSERLLAELVDNGWGKGWGLYFVSKATIGAVQRHFEQFKTVEGFRFWDAPLVRDFLSTAESEVAAQFSGPVDEWILEHGSGFCRILRGRTA